MLEKTKKFITECVRVFKITKKPTKEEFNTILKASALGITIIGLLGFIIQILWTVTF
ncbi:MAG TPA: protein translocase SEC61 complex subunit gamma [Candidatus Nanoarchaeia archaeon]|nr:protein translocase SEC61 complex subunit gamma [Candidatus Nanoarchaeia archaeon]